MPLIEDANFRPVPLLGNAHVQTVLPSLFRWVRGLEWRRQRLELLDGDFLDLDWLTSGSSRLLVISHGLEGDSRRPYVAGMARAASRAGWDAVAWNFRGCSGELNRLPRFYHSGASVDLGAVVLEAGKRGIYRTIVTLGFSLGGNMTLKFLGEDHPAAKQVAAGVAISVPCDLKGSSEIMEQSSRALYMRRFQKDILRKWDQKRRLFPALIPKPDYQKQRTFRDLDRVFTAPIHGFETEEHYWAKCSANRFLADIPKPTLILNALDDPFLSPSCFPRAIARLSDRLHLEIPRKGGHVGFVDRLRPWADLWAERRTMTFLKGLFGSKNR